MGEWRGSEYATFLLKIGGPYLFSPKSTEGWGKADGGRPSGSLP